MSATLATVIIPIYRLPLSKEETLSLEQIYSVLSNYPIAIIKPETLDISPLLHTYPQLVSVSFGDEYFAGIKAYNRLMLSEDFYARFLDTDYILISQLDAYVFRDELSDWCQKGFDYVGAPWLQKPIYRFPVIRQWMNWRLHRAEQRGRPSKQLLYNKVGNGGFSLRKVQSHYLSAQKYKPKIAQFLSQQRSHLFNEDVFWATEVPEFSYPSVGEALLFSFDKYPSYCYRLTNGRLPFGCHGWYKRKMKSFWRRIIRP